MCDPTDFVVIVKFKMKCLYTRKNGLKMKKNIRNDPASRTVKPMTWIWVYAIKSIIWYDYKKWNITIRSIWTKMHLYHDKNNWPLRIFSIVLFALENMNTHIFGFQFRSGRIDTKYCSKVNSIIHIEKKRSIKHKSRELDGILLWNLKIENKYEIN